MRASGPEGSGFRPAVRGGLIIRSARWEPSVSRILFF